MPHGNIIPTIFPECGHVSQKNVGLSKIHTLGAIWVASNEKKRILISHDIPKGSTTAILPIAKFRSKYFHSCNNARDVHPDGCKAIQMFSTNLRESVFIREVFSKQTAKTRVSDTYNDIHPWMRCCFIWHRWKSMLKDLTSFWGSSLFSMKQGRLGSFQGLYLLFMFISMPPLIKKKDEGLSRSCHESR